MSTTLDNADYPDICPECHGWKRHRWYCPMIPAELRRAALDAAVFEGDISDPEYYAERDRLEAAQ